MRDRGKSAGNKHLGLFSAQAVESDGEGRVVYRLRAALVQKNTSLFVCVCATCVCIRNIIAVTEVTCWDKLFLLRIKQIVKSKIKKTDVYFNDSGS